MFAASELIKSSTKRDYLQAILGSGLSWMKFIIVGLFAYSFINYHFCKYISIAVAGESYLWDYWRIKGDSGLIMFGYGSAAVILYRFWRS